MRRVLRAGIATALVAVVAACSYPTRNIEATALDPRQGYVWSALDENELRDTVFIVTASGGGTRAAALTLSALKGLAKTQLPSGRNLADEIDIFSSVSGGSVTAAYFALRGSEGFATLENDFIRQDGIGTLAWRGLNPVGLAELSTPAKERIDLLIDYLEETLFGGNTYQALINRRKRPYLILNAGDMVAGTPFPFTQAYFELLCSELKDFKLSEAVAASAAFPAALSPVTLTNYSPCELQNVGRWPPTWVQNAANTDWYQNPSRTRRGRVAQAYALGTSVPAPYGKDYIHLLDGGIADNLGISEPFRFLTTMDVHPMLYNEIAQGNIRRVVFVVVNSRSEPTSALNAEKATPGIISMVTGTISAAMDNATFSTFERMRALLKERFDAAANDPYTPPVPAQRFRDVETFFIPIDFAAIDDEPCRHAFENIATSWTLPAPQIDAVIEVGQALLGRAPDFQRMLAGTGADIAEPLPHLDDACETIAAAQMAD
ncbi:MAG: patatin-like phospholipase family protein [Alphaproteobacteria bacterium]|nr:patatin-like phospholipase family protein [Alphaproteobacteria bacterium]